MDPVAVVKYRGSVGEAIEEAMELIGGLECLESPFIVKPNICTERDETGAANTKMETVEALVNMVLEKDEEVSIRIVESDSMSKFADEAFQRFGYKTLVERLTDLGFDVSLVNLSQSPVVKVSLDGLYLKNPSLPRLLTESAYFVSVAVPKTHNLTLITGVLKNLFGLLPRKDQAFYHPHINEVIVDVNRLVRPNLCLVDARVGLEGILKGKPRRLNAFILGRNPVSVDATMARIMGFQPERIRHLVMAERYGLGTLHPKLVGKNVESTTVNFKPPPDLKSTALID